ncbi:ERCC4 domain-containing protein [Halopelagius longus]|uniref:DNA-binding protein n=1 Tax=Halopelagius longus TaxID=1236180 RepID=A0A1H0Y6B5_9EURY|nr:helix-hairpin-helix domain-containing protein [Halopelagius longus]RDI72299.1 DNA-binding protein [Halopelagius longus]SDQ10630.1 ERCC4-type nuclease [Halopelagius longus]
MSLAVVVDDREPAAVAEAVRAHPDVESVESRRLDAGDVVMGNVGVERKTLSDYVSTLIGRRAPDLRDQVRRLSEAYEHSYVLLEAELPADGDEGVPAAAVRGSAASLTARLGTPVIPCSDRDRLVDMAVRLGRKHVEEPSSPALPNGSVTALDAPTAKRMYGCIDGVGTDTAGRLYDAYPSVEEIVAASPEELMAVDGIGPKRADAIHSAFRGGE